LIAATRQHARLAIKWEQRKTKTRNKVQRIRDEHAQLETMMAADIQSLKNKLLEHEAMLSQVPEDTTQINTATNQKHDP